MIEFSSKTAVNKPMRLPELMRAFGADKAARQEGRGIKSALLANVINADSLNSSSFGAVKEIFVFHLTLSSPVPPERFIAAMDRQINFPTLFVLFCGGKHMLCAAIKQDGEKGIKVGKRYFSPWLEEKEVTPLPMWADSTDKVYLAIFAAILPLSVRGGEDAQAFTARYDAVEELRSYEKKLLGELKREVQPKKRFELNTRLKKVREEIQKLTS